MSDDNKPTEAEWQMPEPVVRSTEGRTPGSTEVPSEAVTDEIKLSDEDAALAVEEVRAYGTSEGSGIGSLFFIIAVIAFLGAALVYALYSILSARPADTTF